MWVLFCLILFITSATDISAKKGLVNLIPREILFGLCHNVPTASNVDLVEWTSRKWFEIARYNNAFERNTECTSQVYFLDASNDLINIGISAKYPNGSYGVLDGLVKIYASDPNLNMSAKFSDDSTESSFSIMATDNENYAVVYSCWQVSTGSLPEKQERVWVLSRDRNLSEEFSDVVNQTLLFDDEDLNRYLDQVSHENCS